MTKDGRMPDEPNNEPKPNPKPADAGGGGGEPGGGAPAQPNAVDRNEFTKVVGQRDEFKAELRALQEERRQLRETFGGEFSAEDLKQLRELREAQAEQERKAAEERGEYEKLLEQTRQEHESTRTKIAQERDSYRTELLREKLRGQAMPKLVALDVVPDALEDAMEKLIRGDSSGVSMDLVPSDNGKGFKTVLRTSTGTWPVDPETGAELTLEQHLAGFKNRNAYYFKASVKPGSGGGGGDGRVPGGGPGNQTTPDDAAREVRDAAREGRSVENYGDKRKALFGVDTPKAG